MRVCSFVHVRVRVHAYDFICAHARVHARAHGSMFVGMCLHLHACVFDLASWLADWLDG